jgi:Skp family chaperone for outer membrane proteins
MSEEISTPAAEVAEAGTDVATETTVNTEVTPQDVLKSMKHKKKAAHGRDRVAEALAEVKAGPKPDTPDNISLDTLTTADALDDGGHKGIDFNRVINDLPDDAKKMLSNIRSDYTRKTQELAAQRKELESMRQTLLDSQVNENVQKIAAEDNVALDPYDTQSFEKRIEQEVARRLNEMLQPMREEQEVIKRRASLEKFKTENPDLMEYKIEVATLLKNNENLSLEDAYHIAKGRAVSDENAKLKAELQQRQTRMREVGLKLGNGTVRGKKKVPEHLKKGHEIYAWLASNKGR